MRLVGVIRPDETKEISAEGDTYDEAKAALEAALPAGWQLLAITQDRSAPNG